MPNTVVVLYMIAYKEDGAQRVRNTSGHQQDKTKLRHGIIKRFDGQQYDPAHSYIQDGRQFYFSANRNSFYYGTQHRTCPHNAKHSPANPPAQGISTRAGQ